MKRQSKLSIVGLTALVISSVIGGGFYSLPQNLIKGSSLQAILVTVPIIFFLFSF